MSNLAPGSPRRCKLRSRAAIQAVAAVILVTFEAHAQVGALPPPTTLRTLHGQITGGGHEPIRGAVVQLRNDGSETLITYITGNNGHYRFQRLDSNTDYEVWVIFRGRRSRTHSISKFDSHMDKVINFRLRLY